MNVGELKDFLDCCRCNDNDLVYIEEDTMNTRIRTLSSSFEYDHEDGHFVIKFKIEKG